MQLNTLKYSHFLMAAWFVATLTACGFERAGSSRELAQRVRPAKLITVGQGGEPESLNFPAVVQSSQQTEMSFEVGGMLNELFAVEGSRVQKGEVLAKLDQRDLQAKQSSAQAQFKHANTEYQRALRLIKAKAISRSILEQREYQYDVSKLQLKTARKALQDSILRAPFSGAISRVSVEAREVVRAGEPAITILGQGQLEAKLNLPSQIMANAGDSGKPQLEGYLVLDVAPQKRIPATFKSVSLEADTASQTYEVTFTFAEPDGLMILPGMNGVVWLRAPQSEVETLAGLSIPLASIATDGEQHYVWVVNSRSMRLSRRNIVLEEGVGARLNVITGLEVQEIIVAAGISYLSEGMKIRPWSN